MTHLRIEVDHAELFDGDIEGWTPPPVLPDNPNPVDYNTLPEPVRQALALAMGKAMQQTTGYRVTVEV
ncbi:MAG: hypothetical protein K0U84_01705 [Actinomycetia bacterium]|nr:hypothetical protein [Actinomycetes bacterium]